MRKCGIVISISRFELHKQLA